MLWFSIGFLLGGAAGAALTVGAALFFYRDPYRR
jgi:hypothetical protein